MFKSANMLYVACTNFCGWMRRQVIFSVQNAFYGLCWFLECIEHWHAWNDHFTNTFFFPFFLTIAIWRSLLRQLWNNLIMWYQFSFWLNQALQLFCMRVVLMHVHVKFDLHYSCQVIILLYKLQFGIFFNMELLIYSRFWCIAMICDKICLTFFQTHTALHSPLFGLVVILF